MAHRRDRRNHGDWQTVGRNPRNEAAPTSLLIDLDIPTNDAETAWRQHALPISSIAVPADLIWEDNQMDTIARRYQTFVFSQHRRGDGEVIKFDIWGEKQAVHATKQAIHDWVVCEAPSKRVRGDARFMKTGSMLPNQRANEEKRWAKEVAKHRYRQFPPHGSVFGAIGSFHWPVSVYQPQEALGNNHEALDAIRMDCESYIVWDKDCSTFQVMGDAGNVKQAVLRIRQVCFQVAVRQIMAVRKYLLHGNSGSEPSHVVMVPCRRPTDIEGTLPRREGKSPRGIAAAPATTEINARDAVRLTKKCLLATLAKLHYYRGHLELRARLGTFLAVQYRSPTSGQYELSDFRDMLGQSQFVGEVSVELGSEPVEKTALRSLQAASHLLVPQNVVTEDLSDVKPVYTAVFVIADPGGDYRLSITWHDPANSSPRSSEFEEFRRQWTRLDRRSGSVNALLDISLIDLEHGSAWQFDLAASHAVDNSRIPTDLQRFADSVRLDLDAARAGPSEKPFVKWNPFVPLTSLQQRVSYRYGLMSSDYTCELSHFQDRIFKRMSLNMPTNVIYESRWSLEVYHNLWDTMFARNAHLAVGSRADWGDSAWFPANTGFGDAGSEGNGFDQLVEQLEKIAEVVWSQQ